MVKTREQMVKFCYLGVDTDAVQYLEAEMNYEVDEGAKVLGALREV